MIIKEVQLKNEAKKAVEFFTADGKHNGGNKLRWKMNAYGIALKYIFITRDLTYVEVAEKYGSTPQNINYIVNRMKKKQFNPFFVDKLCQMLSVDSGFFNDLVKEIENILEEK